MKAAHDVKITTGEPVRLKIVPGTEACIMMEETAMPVNIYAVDEKGRGVAGCFL